jgi:hypothetical protein
LLLERLRLLPPVHKYALEWLRLCTGHPGVLVSDKNIFDSISQDEEDEAVAGARSGPASFIKNDDFHTINSNILESKHQESCEDYMKNKN